MTILLFTCVLVAAAAAAAGSDHEHTLEHQNFTVCTNTSKKFLKEQLIIGDVMYSTPAVMLVGGQDGILLKCLQDDPSDCEILFDVTPQLRDLDFDLEYFTKKWVLRGNYVYIVLTTIQNQSIYSRMTCGKFMRCDLYGKNTCITFDIDNVRNLAFGEGNLYMGFRNNTIMRCEEDHPTSCVSLHTVNNTIIDLILFNKYLYVVEEFKNEGYITRCSLTVSNSCVQFHVYKYVSPYGITTFKNNLLAVEWNNALRNFTHLSSSTVRGDASYINPCNHLYVSEHANMGTGEEPRDIATYNGSLYTMHYHYGTSQNSMYIQDIKTNQTNCLEFRPSFSYEKKYFDYRKKSFLIRNIAFAYGTHHMLGKYKTKCSTCDRTAECRLAVYCTESERAALEVYVKDGILYHSNDTLVDTSDADQGHAGPAAIFIMRPDGRIMISKRHRRGIIDTSSFLAGNPVSGAGEMVVERGVIKKIMACSEHYLPDIELNRQVIGSLISQGYASEPPIELQMCHRQTSPILKELDKIMKTIHDMQNAPDGLVEAVKLLYDDIQEELEENIMKLNVDTCRR